MIRRRVFSETLYRRVGGGRGGGKRKQKLRTLFRLLLPCAGAGESPRARTSRSTEPAAGTTDMMAWLYGNCTRLRHGMHGEQLTNYTSETYDNDNNNNNIRQ